MALLIDILLYTYLVYSLMPRANQTAYLYAVPVAIVLSPLVST